jgi:signal peptidase II
LARHDLRITALFAATTLITLDQISKALAGWLLADGRLHSAGPGSGFRRVHNRRAGLVAMSLSRAATVWVASLLGASVALALASPALGTGGALGLGLVLGGATSNLADRVVRGGVLDFIALGPWPTFNLADAAMVAGVALLAGGML